MFGTSGFGAGKAAYPQVYAVNKPLRHKDSSSSPSQEYTHSLSPSTESLEPAIDGPPSPDQIRAYTEHMKRSSIFGNNSRTNTLSSGTSSFNSRESTTASTESLSLSRKSSGRSNASNMPSSRLDRPESVQIFGRSLFSRRGRKDGKKDKNELGTPVGDYFSERSVRDERPNSQWGSSRRGTMFNSRSPPLLPEEHRQRSRHHLISHPFDFQHVTHTGQDHLPNLERVSHQELVSEFSTIRASQAPSNGELKGIRAEDLHFDNFSSGALDSPESLEDFPIRPSSGHRRTVLRKSIVPQKLQRPVVYTKSHDNIRAAPPARPPRSPLSPSCPVALPARISSRPRTASILYDTFDPLTTPDGPQILNEDFRQLAPLGLSIPLPAGANEEISEQTIAHAVSTTPTDEAWPLTASPMGKSSGELADVQEEDEEAFNRKSRLSTASGELRMSQSVPALRLRSLNQPGVPQPPVAAINLHRTTAPKVPLSPGFTVAQDSWDNAIDYAYEHEAEADCDYQWDLRSVDDGTTTVADVSSVPVEQPEPELDLHLNDGHPVYHGRFRPSLLVPSTLDLPELSPMSLISTNSDPRTPHFHRPMSQIRSPSHASSFKESQGFNLSPSLIIPTDYQSHMDQGALYEQHYGQQTDSAGALFVQEPFYINSVSPVDGSISSTTSYRSSSYSRASQRSSSSTRISHTTSRDSKDSMILGHGIGRSIGSASSLPDLIHSNLRKPEQNFETDLSHSVGALDLEAEEEKDEFESGPEVPPIVMSHHRRNTSLVREPGLLRKGVNHFAPPSPLIEGEALTLSPVAEQGTGFDFSGTSTLVQGHGRKISAPVASFTVSEFKGRARSSTATGSMPTGVRKQRSSYMLFPQTRE